MFSEKKNNSMNSDLTKEQNKIAQGTVFKGGIESQGSFRIEGKVIGNIKTPGKIVVGKTGYIEGQIECENADFEGEFKGELKVSKLLTLRATAKIEGEVFADKLSIEPGAVFNATCSMKGAMKSISGNAKKEQSA
ncbi:bactofilin family protein [Psychroflexus lacisalsi]|jgi:cytoskeletal protein CcmA (bactofilin family)|uniref:Polymer-forming cytoskeletal protein n=1 Tax=Psychroflexus lacisalsi TaxID=503928 RepID=A0ABN1K3D9_9FLAO|nr:polymer-forming cytoskeletal protein [Psychroflexus lacisalsi]MBZ9618756.1 polymer-forming cytoskeletal protein [Psychroflexus lacisalsi]